MGKSLFAIWLARLHAWWTQEYWPDRGAFVISTEMDPQFDPPSCGLWPRGE
jgi:hypothetical protein